MERLSAYGFEEDIAGWSYKTEIMDGKFTLYVHINQDGNGDTNLIEKETGDAYVLYKTNATGPYVGEIRKTIEEVLRDIADKCYEPSVFRANQSLMLIEYVRETYGDELQFLWQKFPDNAIWRRKDSKKWYGVIGALIGSKIGLASDRIVEIVVLRMRPEHKEELLTREDYYPGWHMNKKNWYTILLDAGVPDEELCQRIDESYQLAVK